MKENRSMNTKIYNLLEHVVICAFIFFTKITECQMSVTANKIPKIYANDIGNIRKNGVRVDHYGRCFAEKFLDDVENKNLVNSEGISIVELERSLFTASDNSLDNISSTLKDSPQMLSELIEKTIVDHMDGLQGVLNKYHIYVDQNLQLAKEEIDMDMVYLSYKIKEGIKQILHTMNTPFLQQLRYRYRRLKKDAIYDIMYLENILHTLDFSDDMYLTDSELLTRFDFYWRDIKKQKPQLEALIKDANELIHICSFSSFENRDRFPFCFLTDDAVYKQNQSARNLLQVTSGMIYNEISRCASVRSTLDFSINTNTLTEVSNHLLTTIDTMNKFATYMCHKLMTYLNVAVGGPLRGFLALFLYIFKTMETKNLYSIEQNAYSHRCIKNKNGIHSYLERLYKQEQIGLNKGKTHFKNVMYSFFKIKIEDSQWNVLNTRLAYSENFDNIIRTLKYSSEVILVRRQLLHYKKILTLLWKKVDKYMKQQGIEKGVRSQYNIPDTVNISEKFHTKILTLYNKHNMFYYDLIWSIAFRNRYYHLRMTMISNVEKMKVILNWMNLFEKIEDGKLKREIQKMNCEFSAECFTGEVQLAATKQQKKKLKHNIFNKWRKPKTDKNVTENLEVNEEDQRSNVSINDDQIKIEVLYFLLYVIYRFYYDR